MLFIDRYTASDVSGDTKIVKLDVLCFSFDSFQWPYCDGSHGTHNKECGDNLGPVVLKRNPDK